MRNATLEGDLQTALAAKNGWMCHNAAVRPVAPCVVFDLLFLAAHRTQEGKTCVCFQSYGADNLSGLSTDRGSHLLDLSSVAPWFPSNVTLGMTSKEQQLFSVSLMASFTTIHQNVCCKVRLQHQLGSCFCIRSFVRFLSLEYQF